MSIYTEYKIGSYDHNIVLSQYWQWRQASRAFYHRWIKYVIKYVDYKRYLRNDITTLASYNQQGSDLLRSF